MRNVSAREANQAFSRILGEAEAGEEFVITRQGRPVARLAPYRQPEVTLDKPEVTPERKAVIEHVIEMMENAPRLGTARRFGRDEMHER